jgi:hypothetical protein
MNKRFLPEIFPVAQSLENCENLEQGEFSSSVVGMKGDTFHSLPFLD